MKKFINIISWVSFAVIALAIVLVSVFAGAMVCNYLADVLHIAGRWWSLLLVPVMLVVGVAVELFLMLGATKVRLS